MKRRTKIASVSAALLFGAAGIVAITAVASVRDSVQSESAALRHASSDSLNITTTLAWSQFLRTSEAEIRRLKHADPDTLVEAGDERLLIYRGPEAFIFHFTAGLLDEQVYTRYYPSLALAQAHYAALAANLLKEHGEPTMQINTGTMWIFTPTSAADSLSVVIAGIRNRTGVPGDSLGLRQILSAVPEGEREEFVQLLGRHRVERLYIQKIPGEDIYTVTFVRAVGPRALWDSRGNLGGIGSL